MVAALHKPPACRATLQIRCGSDVVRHDRQPMPRERRRSVGALGHEILTARRSVYDAVAVDAWWVSLLWALSLIESEPHSPAGTRLPER